MYQIDSVHPLTVIIPFKSNNISPLTFTIHSLNDSAKHASIQVLVACDISCYDTVKRHLNGLTLRLHSITVFPCHSRGIYSAINSCLDRLNVFTWYTVLGAGDYLNIASIPFLDPSVSIFRIPYFLSTNLDRRLTTFKPIWSGCPYCHNALFFRVNSIRYSTSFRIASDYLYLLDYLSLSRTFDLNIAIPFFNCGFTIFDQSGVSSTNKFALQRETFSIVSTHFPFYYLFLFFLYRFFSFVFKLIPCV